MTRNEITLAIFGADGSFLLDDTDAELGAAMQADLSADLGVPEGTACAAPAQTILQLPPAARGVPSMRIGGYWHDSLIDGPGHRSVVRMQGCPIRCVGCYVPETWRILGGTAVSIDDLANCLLSSAHERDGVTIIGGEPFAQPMALLQLVTALWARRCPHIVVYTGYTLEVLRARDDRAIDMVLAGIDVLIDGPYVEALAQGLGVSPYTGSSNQRVQYNAGGGEYVAVEPCEVCGSITPAPDEPGGVIHYEMECFQ